MVYFLTFIIAFIFGWKFMTGYRREKDIPRNMARMSLALALSDLVTKHKLPNNHFFTKAVDCLNGSISYCYTSFNYEIRPVLGRKLSRGEFYTFLTATVCEQYTCLITCISEIFKCKDIYSAEFLSDVKAEVKKYKETYAKYITKDDPINLINIE